MRRPGGRAQARARGGVAGRLVVAAVVACSAGGGVAPTAHAGASPDPDQAHTELLVAYADALVAVTDELAFLATLGWVDPPAPDAVLEVPSAAAPRPASRQEVLAALRLVDGTRGPAVLARLDRLGEQVAPEVRTVLSRNLPEPGAVDPRVGAGPYVGARDRIVTRWTELGGRTPPVAPRPVTVGGAGDGGTSSPPAGSPVLVVAAVAGAAVVLAGVVRWRRRRRSGDRSQVRHDDVLDAGRAILAATDRQQFGHAVAAQVRRLTGARGGALVVDGESFVDGEMTLPARAVIDRVISTGRPARDEGTSVVPVVVDGRVRAVLAATDVASPVERVLADVAPLVGAALDGVVSRAASDQLAFVDGLTQVGNRRRFDQDLARLAELGGPGRPPSPTVAVAMVDVDHFKAFNDTHGHQAGDDVLRAVAGVIGANVRDGDLVYRYGGEEFAVLLPGADLDEARVVVERVRAAIEATDVGSAGRVTVSVGVSASAAADGTTLLRAADAALYEAKSAGRNRVVVAAG